MSGAVVINLREWCAARARNAKVRALLGAIKKYCKGQGPYDALAQAMVARRLTEASWEIVEQIAGVAPSSALTRQLVLDELEDRAREIRLAAITTEAQ
ncbi:MAG TPA: hypothetical protein VGH28_14060 [Polyangiaceae bacterium]